MTIPLIGQKPQLPPTHILGGPLEDGAWLQYAPIGMLSLEDMEKMKTWLEGEIARVKVSRAARLAVIQGNGTGG